METSCRHQKKAPEATEQAAGHIPEGSAGEANL